MGHRYSKYFSKQMEKDTIDEKDPRNPVKGTEKVDGKDQRNPVYIAILECVSDSNSYWCMLRGTPHIVGKIWDIVVKCWKETIVVPTIKPDFTLQTYYMDCGLNIKFPRPKTINVNMMPFILSKKFERTLLPTYLKSYHEKFISECIKYHRIYDEVGKVCYLSIHECRVKANKSQRRPGIHTECPGVVKIENIDSKGEKGKGVLEQFPNGWGNGVQYYNNELVGGIFMASNVADSCKVWNCEIPLDSNGREIIGKFGDVEHLREFLPEGKIIKANALYWITDRTPHESLPVHNGTYRQWCRLVTSQVSLWFEDHSTRNPNGVRPDPNITKIVKGSKFNDDTLIVIPHDEHDLSSGPSTSTTIQDQISVKNEHARKKCQVIPYSPWNMIRTTNKDADYQQCVQSMEYD